MNNEIKEILDDLKNTGYEKLSKNIENIIDYITNLQQENERLKTKTKEQSLLLIDYQDMEQKLKKYKSRIEKVIEYIEENKVKAYPVYGDYTDTDFEINLNVYEVNDLLNILNGKE